MHRVPVYAWAALVRDPRAPLRSAAEAVRRGQRRLRQSSQSVEFLYRHPFGVPADAPDDGAGGAGDVVRVAGPLVAPAMTGGDPLVVVVRPVVPDRALFVGLPEEDVVPFELVDLI